MMMTKMKKKTKIMNFGNNTIDSLMPSCLSKFIRNTSPCFFSYHIMVVILYGAYCNKTSQSEHLHVKDFSDQKFSHHYCYLIIVIIIRQRYDRILRVKIIVFHHVILTELLKNYPITLFGF